MAIRTKREPDSRQRWLQLLIRIRHVILLAFLGFETWLQRGNTDWVLISKGSIRLFSSTPLSAYANSPRLQAGPPSLPLMRGLIALPGSSGLWVAHIFLALLAWYLIFATERWRSPGATFFAAPSAVGMTTLVVGLPVLQAWAALAGTAPHLEDGLAIASAVFALRAISQRRETVGALLVGLAVAWKPWAVAALPLVWGLPRRGRALCIALAVPAVCWLPFLLGDPSTLSQLGHGFVAQQNSILDVLGFSQGDLPVWWRSLQLSGVLLAAAVAAIKRDWRVAFAAGCTARLVLDPAVLDYYDAGLILATFATERITGAPPWRTLLLWFGLTYSPLLVHNDLGACRLSVLLIVLVSWVYPWRATDNWREAWRRMLPQLAAAGSVTQS